MLRTIIELVMTIVVMIVGRAILASLRKGFANATRDGFDQNAKGHPAGQRGPDASTGANAPRERVSVAGELHKDPVCGTYVAESTSFKRQNGRDIFYYCSEACKDKHAVAARS